MWTLTAKEQIGIFARYIGQKVKVTYEHDHTAIGILEGIKIDALQIRIDGVARWFPLYDDFTPYTVKLLIKPLSELTKDITEQANQLPVQNFITQYYNKLGFDMPVFIAPEHPANCHYIEELGLAEYVRTQKPVLQVV